jgi:arylformamidase
MKLYRDFCSQEDIDLQYNTSLAVPDRDSWIEWFSEESSRVRQEIDCILDVRYGPTLDETVDIFPAKETNAPVLVFIHGGYWIQGTSKKFSLVARGPVSRGVTVVVTNYSLCPEVSIEEITRQSRSAIAWLYKNASGFNIDPEQIFVSGHSAGGQQVGMLVSTDWASNYGLPDFVIKGGITISGIFDLNPLRYSFLQPKLLLTHEIILRQSPYFNIPKAAPPLLLSFGSEETAEFHRQSIDYLQAWQANGLAGELFVQESKHHFSAIGGMTDGNSKLCDMVVDIINSNRAK